jgi:SOS-response transcriptional repressor LexA
MAEMLDSDGDLTTRILFAVLDGTNSVRDIQTQLGVPSTATVHRHLNVLRERGLVSWAPGKQRTLRATCAPVWATN